MPARWYSNFHRNFHFRPASLCCWSSRPCRQKLLLPNPLLELLQSRWSTRSDCTKHASAHVLITNFQIFSLNSRIMFFIKHALYSWICFYNNLKTIAQRICSCSVHKSKTPNIHKKIFSQSDFLTSSQRRLATLFNLVQNINLLSNLPCIFKNS